MAKWAMDRRHALRILAETVGGLRPTAGATNADLRAVRSLFAESLLREGDASLGDSGAVGQLLRTPLANVDEVTAAELRAAIEAVSGAESRGAGSPAFRIRRRDLPVAGIALPGSAPSPTSGAAIEQSFGPFLTGEDRPVWFDVFRLARFIPLVRLPGGAPLLFASIRGLLGSATSYPIDRGSIWINSQLLAASAPSGSYSGLRVAGGRLELSSLPTVAGTTIQVGAVTEVTVTIELEHIDPLTDDGGPGGDARAVRVELPREVTFVFSPGGREIRIASESRLRLYGTSMRLKRNAEPPTYEPAVNRVLVPFDVTPRTVTITDVRSHLFQPSDAAQVESAAWALPVAVLTPTRLTDAAGAGALAVVVAPGLRGTWRGLAGGTAALGRTFFLAEPDTLTAVAPSAGNRKLTQVCDLWIDSENSSRHCSVELAYDKPAVLTFVSAASGIEVVIYSGSARAHLDKPVRADGHRLRIGARDAVLVIGDDATGSTVLVVAFARPNAATMVVLRPEPIAFALSNALLKTTPPEAFILFGRRQDERLVHEGTLQLHFGLLLLLPMLPDPYASNLQNPRERVEGSPTGRFIASVQWSHPSAPNMALTLSDGDAPLEASLAPTIPPTGDTDDPVNFNQSRLGSEQRRIIEEDRQRIKLLREQFDRTTGAMPEQVLLLDVSSHADQFGVGVGLSGRGRHFEPSSELRGSRAPLTIDGVSLAAELRNARIFTVPQIQWEPVWTIQNPDLGHFPSPLSSADDGGPTFIGINSVRLVPIAPHPVVADLVDDFRRTETADAAALFTLPFGMRAVAAPLRRPLFPGVALDAPGASLDLIIPEFRDPKLVGGLQISLKAIGPAHSPDSPTSALPGATVQTRNGIDPATRMPLFISVLGDTDPPATDEDVPNAVESIFNGEFAPDGTYERVPLTRIDLSGYGASTFSRWRNPEAELAETSKVEFNTLVGRTAYEVIQVRCVLLPCQALVVRTITIQRTGSGGVFRRDSGWVPVTDGLFNSPVHASVPKIETHPGVVKAFVNIRRIRDTTHVYRREYGSGSAKTTVRLAAVKFDADIRISGVLRGGTDGRVTSVDQIGFVQLAPSGKPLSPEQYADLLADQGPLGGPVDCVIDVGRSGQQMRVTRVDVGSARTKGGQIEFAAAARGSVVLPRNGQWSTVSKPADNSKESVAVDRHMSISLVREGKSGLDDSVNAAPYRFAEPAHLLDPNSAPFDYGLLWSTGTQRVLFYRPKIDSGAKAITSERAPLLADTYALVSSVGIFPSAATCLEVPFANWSLDIPAEGHMRLSMPSPTFPAVRVAGGTQRDLSASGAIRMYVDYTNTRFTVQLDTSAAPSWSYRQEGIALVNESNGVRVKTSGGRIHADSGTAAQFTLQTEEFGEKLDKAKPIMPMFSSNNLSGSIPSGGATTPVQANDKAEEKKTKVGVKIELPIPPKTPILIGFVEEGKIEIATDFQNYFSLKVDVEARFALLFPLFAKFRYEGAVLKAGTKEELMLAIGWSGGFESNWLCFDFDVEFFIGIGFVDESAPGKGSIGIGAVFVLNGTASYPSRVFKWATVGLEIEGQGLFVSEHGDHFLVLKGTIAFEITLAVFVSIEFELLDATLAELPL